jgi:hypothetical protein
MTLTETSWEIRRGWLPAVCYAFRAELMDCCDVEEATRRPLVDIEHWAKPPLNEYCGPQATALRQAAERVLAPTAKE